MPHSTRCSTAFGVWGIPLATSVVNIAGSAALMILMRRRLGRIDFGRIADSVIRIIVASAVVAGVTYGVWYGVDQVVGRSLIGQIVSVGTALAAGTGVYLVACRALHVRELGALLALRSRFSGAQP